jgi:hypothetical protein
MKKAITNITMPQTFDIVSFSLSLLLRYWLLEVRSAVEAARCQQKHSQEAETTDRDEKKQPNYEGAAKPHGKHEHESHDDGNC